MDIAIDSALRTTYRRDARTNVWHPPQRTEFPYSDGEDAERYLFDALKGAEDLSCGSDELVGLIRDWPSEYHLSPTRLNLLSGLRLQPHDRVLEIGAGCGAMTRLIGESGAQVLAIEGSARRAEIAACRCRDLHNVQVCSDGFQRFDLDLQFDAATLIGVLEYAPSFFEGDDPALSCLSHVFRYLREGGALVLAIENRLGLKYFNGAGEDHTSRPFDSLNNLYPGDTCQTFSKVELEGKLRQAGFQELEFIFPFPDYKLPKLLLRESALGDPDLDVGVLAAQYPGVDYVLEPARLFSEARLWPSLVREGLLPALANSFLVVAVKGAGKAAGLFGDDWLARSFASDRKRAYRTTNTFARGPAGLTVGKAVAAGRVQAGPLVHRGASEERYRGGAPYNASLQRIAFSEQGYTEYLDYLRRYVGYLESHCATGQVDAMGFDRFLPGSWYDRIPCNLMDAGTGELVPIDQEWESAEQLPLHYLVLRAILHDLSRVDCFGSLSLFAGEKTLGDFIERVFDELGLAVDREQLVGLVGREDEALRQVLPEKRVPRFAEAIERAPGDLFPQVHDMLTWRVPGGRDAPSPAEELAGRLHALEAELAAQRRVVGELRGSLSYRLGRVLAGAAGWPVRALRRAGSRGRPTLHD
jgi:SAM-dependent methyltransferase